MTTKSQGFSKRQRQVAEQVRQALSSLLMHYQTSDGTTLNITLTEVQMSPDLRHARVYVVPLHDQGTKACDYLTHLKQEAPRLQHNLQHLVNLRFLPRLRFVEDTAFDTADAIQDTLSQIKKPKDTSSCPQP